MIKISQRQCKTAVRLLTGMVLLATASACTKDEATDYCKNHYVYHYEHKDQLTTLNLQVAESGLVTAELTLKGDNAADYNSNPAFRQSLLDSKKIFQIDSAGECSEGTTMQGGNPDSPLLTFESQCTADAKINQVDITLFDNMPQLDEIEATIVTPATRKHFAISRQCDGAIFRLAKKQDVQ